MQPKFKVGDNAKVCPIQRQGEVGWIPFDPIPDADHRCEHIKNMAHQEINIGDIYLSQKYNMYFYRCVGHRGWVAEQCITLIPPPEPVYDPF